MAKSFPTDHIYSLVRSRLGADATIEMIESVSRRVASLLADGAADAEPGDEMADTSAATRLLLTVTGRDTPEAAAGLMAQLQSYGCQVLGSGRASADGYFSLLVSLDTAGCPLSHAELAAALEVTGEADGLKVALMPIPPALADQAGGRK